VLVFSLLEGNIVGYVFCVDTGYSNFTLLNVLGFSSPQG